MRAPEQGQVVVTGADGVSRLRPVGPARPALPVPPPLTPIEGPSAFGSEGRRFWHLLWLISVQQYRLQYRTSILGYLWTVLRPLTLFAVLYFVFSEILRFGGDIPNYALMILLGIMLYQFFMDGTGTALGALVTGEPIVRKMHFPRVVIPLSVVVSSGMTAAMNLLVALAFVLVLGDGALLSWLLVPIVLIALAALVTGVALLLSTLFVWIRDVGQIWAVIARALFYASPILYPLELVPDQFRWIVALNPLVPIFHQARILVLHPDAPGVVETMGVGPFVGSCSVGVALCLLGLWLFVRQAPRVAERL